MTVTKRDGSHEELDTSKIIASLKWAAQDLNVSIEDVVSNANLHFVDGMTTSSIHDTMIKVTDDMSDLRRDKIDYDKMSARLLMQKIYHDVFNGVRPMSIGHMINKNVQDGHYAATLTLNYSAEEIDELSIHASYGRNFDFSKAGLQTLVDKYLIFANGKPIEDPQTAFMAIAMDAHMYHDKFTRLQMVKDLYDALSTFKVSFPTPMMASLRTGTYDVASCIVIETGDDRESWVATYSAITLHTMSSAG